MSKDFTPSLTPQKAESLLQEFGSPLFVYSEELIRIRYRMLQDSIPYTPKRFHYAVKANTNIHILKILQEEGSWVDAVSPFEVEIALKAGFEPSKILFTGLNYYPEEMDALIRLGIRFNIGSVFTLQEYAHRYPGTEISIRINPDVGAGHHDHCITGGPTSKFGIYQSEIPHIKDILKEHKLKLVGIHSHIGSGIIKESQFIEVMNIILPLTRQFEDIEFVDFGGGIGVPYSPAESTFNLESFGKDASQMFLAFSESYGKKLTFALEPGRFLVAESGVLLTRVTDQKQTPRFHFVGVDTGFNHLVRPMAYGSYHHIVNLTHPDAEPRDVVVGGYLCESGDVFTRTEEGIQSRMIANPQPGDILAIENAGAYGFSMASQYNSRPRPAEVLLIGPQTRLIRRRETLKDLLSTTLGIKNFYRSSQ